MDVPYKELHPDDWFFYLAGKADATKFVWHKHERVETRSAGSKDLVIRFPDIN